MYIGRWWEVGWLMVWWFDGTSVLGGRQTGAGARFGWVEFVV